MKIKICSPVSRSYSEVFSGFSGDLFEYLAPKGQLKLLRFDGCKKGDIIEIQFLKPLKAFWRSEIVNTNFTEQEASFIDQGTVLPYGIKVWNHQHIVRKTGENSCEIIDEIDYQGLNFFVTLFHFVPLYLSFYQRKSKYCSFFE